MISDSATDKPQKNQRQRAPSKPSLVKRARIFDAAERVFAHSGFEGATIRAIAAQAKVPLGLVNHHGGSKAQLFRQVVARRADELSALRLAALQDDPAPSLHSLLRCFFGPYLEKAQSGDPQWVAYARLVALVSADPGQREVSAALFDPTANLFIDEIAKLYPDLPRSRVAEGFVYSVSAMLAFLTARWRIGALSDDHMAHGDIDGLIVYCAAGFKALLTPS